MQWFDVADNGRGFGLSMTTLSVSVLSVVNVMSIFKFTISKYNKHVMFEKISFKTYKPVCQSQLNVKTNRLLD